jgi:hypothetical protein
LQNGVRSAHNTDTLLVLGAIFLALGIMPLAGGLYGYYVTLPEIERSQNTVNEAAEELGLGDIDVSSSDSLAQLFTIMILIGCSAAIAGATLLLVGLARRNGPVERRLWGRKAILR